MLSNSWLTGDMSVIFASGHVPYTLQFAVPFNSSAASLSPEKCKNCLSAKTAPSVGWFPIRSCILFSIIQSLNSPKKFSCRPLLKLVDSTGSLFRWSVRDSLSPFLWDGGLYPTNKNICGEKILISKTVFPTSNKIPSKSLKNDTNEFFNTCTTFWHTRFTQCMTALFDFCCTFVT